MATKPRNYHILDPSHTDPTRVKKEREKAQALKKSDWWNSLLQKGVCHYCQKRFKPAQLTMDHVVPIARGGASTRGNIVPACAACNRDKKLETPVEQIMEQLARERQESEQLAREREESELLSDDSESDE